MFIYIYITTHIYIYIYICIYTCTYIYIYIYIYIFICIFFFFFIYSFSRGMPEGSHRNALGILDFQIVQESVRFARICYVSTGGMAVCHCRMQCAPKMNIFMRFHNVLRRPHNVHHWIVSLQMYGKSCWSHLGGETQMIVSLATSEYVPWQYKFRCRSETKATPGCSEVKRKDEFR